MSTMTDWLGRPGQEAKADQDILADRSSDVDVWRRGGVTDEDAVPGFTEEVAGSTFVRRIRARVDGPSRRSTEADAVGLADHTDVQVDDRWVLAKPGGGTQRFRVSSTTPREVTVEAELVNEENRSERGSQQ